MSGNQQYDPKVDDYIEKATAFAQPVLIHLRNLIHEHCPDVVEVIKWKFPCFVYRDSILCNVAAFKEHCSFGFWKAGLMPDPDQILKVENREGMGNVGKLRSLADLPPDAIVATYIRNAMQLVDDGVKRPKKQAPTEPVQLEVPEDFNTMLDENENACTHFNQFSPSAKKEYLEWFQEAKTEATRNKRMIQAVEWIAEGKTRHWKYKNC